MATEPTPTVQTRTVKASQVTRGMKIRWGREYREVVGAVNTSAGRRTVNVRLDDGTTESRHTDVDAEYTVEVQS